MSDLREKLKEVVATLEHKVLLVMSLQTGTRKEYFVGREDAFRDALQLLRPLLEESDPNARRALAEAQPPQGVVYDKTEEHDFGGNIPPIIGACQPAQSAELTALRAQVEKLEVEVKRLKATACDQSVDKVLDQLAARFAALARLSTNELTIQEATNELRSATLDAFCTLALPFKREADQYKAQAEKLRGALGKIAHDDVPRLVAKPWRGDGKPSKHDLCPHNIPMWQSCGACVSDFACSTLAETSNG